jgi:DNA-binding MarR family transcriptional regulator
MEPVRKEKAIDSAFATSLYFAGGAFARAIGKLATNCWAPSGLPPSQGSLLLHLIDNDYAFSYFISSDLRVNPSAITRLTDQLQAKGYVERFTEDHWTYICATQKAGELRPVLATCEQAFIDRSAELLGKQTSLDLANSLNSATDKLMQPQRGQIVGKQTEIQAGNPDIGGGKSK